MDFRKPFHIEVFEIEILDGFFLLALGVRIKNASPYFF
jgi:hypothetical protein